MLELRSTLVASAVTAAVGLSVAAATPAVAAGTATASKSATAKKTSTKKKAAKKTTKKKTAAPKTVTACVNKKSGATKVLLGSKAKRKCAKGWTKMTWNVAGPAGKNGATGATGATGANGANGSVSVRDSTGKRIGGFGGYLMVGIPLPLIQVIADDGGIYTYLDSTGQLLPISSMSGGGSPLFQDAACAGTAYVSTGSGASPTLALMLGGSSRFVYRSVTGMSTLELGPTRAWKLTASTSVVPPVAPTFYELDTVGACTPVVDDPSTPGDERPQPGGTLVQLAPAIAPPDGVGPLTVG